MLWMIFIGLLIGLVAKFFMPENAPEGLIMTIVLGIADAMLASWASSSMGFYYHYETHGFFAAVLGAMVILFIYHILNNKKKLH